MEGPNMLSRDLVPMAQGCASLAGIGKPLQPAAGRETDATVRGSPPDASGPVAVLLPLIGLTKKC